LLNPTGTIHGAQNWRQSDAYATITHHIQVLFWGFTREHWAALKPHFSSVWYEIEADRVRRK